MKITTIFTLFIALAICSISCGTAKKSSTDVSSTDAQDIQEQIDKAKDGASIVLKKNTYTGTLKISGKKGLTIDFAESKLITENDETIFIIENSSDIKIKGLTIYHKIDGDPGCFSNCFDVNHCKNVSFEKCDINGSGFIGVCINQSDVVIEKSILHKCEFGVYVWNDNEETETVFKDCKVVIKDCEFAENKSNNVVVYSWYVKKATVDVSVNGKSFVLNKDNYKNYQKRSDAAECVLD